MTGPLDPEVVDFARTLFELARNGDAEQLAAYVDPHLGSPDAVATARFFEIGETVALLTRGRPAP